MEIIAILAVLWSLFITIFWLVIGFRAMRAHEGIAESAAYMQKTLTRIATASEQRDRPSNSGE